MNTPFRPLLSLIVPALCVRPTPPSAVASAFAHLAQGLDPDASPDPHDVVWLDAYLDDPTAAGDSPSGIYLPRKCASVEEWYHSPLIAGMRATLQEAEEPPSEDSA
jgi:hypothetical protein